MDNTGTITTAGDHSDSILAQSVGGGGGNGGFSVAGYVGEGSSADVVQPGRRGRQRQLWQQCDRPELRQHHHGRRIVVRDFCARALGGGGGDGGFERNLPGAVERGQFQCLSVAIGGDGGPGLQDSS